MLRIFKTALALAMILALAACSTLTGPVADDTHQTAATQKQQIVAPEEGGGGSSPPAEDPAQEEDATTPRGRGHNRT